METWWTECNAKYAAAEWMLTGYELTVATAVSHVVTESHIILAVATVTQGILSCLA